MEFNSSKPIFIQLSEYYEHLIDLGVLKEGEEMPSVREVALMNNVNPNTVQRAFTLMVEHNYLSNVPKKGFFVLKNKKNNKDIIIKTLNNLKDMGISKDEIMEVMKDYDSNK